MDLMIRPKALIALDTLSVRLANFGLSHGGLNDRIGTNATYGCRNYDISMWYMAINGYFDGK